MYVAQRKQGKRDWLVCCRLPARPSTIMDPPVSRRDGALPAAACSRRRRDWPSSPGRHARAHEDLTQATQESAAEPTCALSHLPSALRGLRTRSRYEPAGVHRPGRARAGSTSAGQGPDSQQHVSWLPPDVSTGRSCGRSRWSQEAGKAVPRPGTDGAGSEEEQRAVLDECMARRLQEQEDAALAHQQQHAVSP